ncbi:hypothetical protein LEP1GSC043_3482 [Leptospira weilii str. Ecochallenge]|uniref:Uncharacterized protein n=1 Tax=Leptospira weilii str. Ecochallenge TaxID=1049986 RepID=N1U3E5_9LEPT|nr:hypothetical protein LEP1GSC043_3482 [Leptospira weilii str. Ecochallenge]
MAREAVRAIPKHISKRYAFDPGKSAAESGNANGTRRFVAAVFDIKVLNKRVRTQRKTIHLPHIPVL